MTQELTLYQVDAFAERVFGGNPAAICPLDAWLPDATMQSIAAENNLSETAFFVPKGDGYDLRWFTPVREVDLCGHATLASAFVVANYLKPGCRQISFDSVSGPLHVAAEGNRFTLDFPSRPPEPFKPTALVHEALGRPALEVLKATKMMAVLEDEAAVLAAEPDLEKVAAFPADGLIVTAPGEACDFVSRYFAPAGGIPEDPVTGSAHCTLTPYWSNRLGKTKMSARQVSKRLGVLEVEDKGERILITGSAVPYMESRIFV